MSLRVANARTDRLKTFVKDFDLCLLCQSTTNEHLQDAFNTRKQSVDECYASIVAILKISVPSEAFFFVIINVTSYQIFDERSKLPLYLSSLVNSVDANVVLKENSAKWHGSCRLFSKDKASKLKNQVEPDANIESSALRQSSRSAVSGTKQLQCVFCDRTDHEGNLHLPTTLSIDEKVRQAATYLRDDKLIGKLSGGDMIAIEARYHLVCLSKFYRKYTENWRTQSCCFY